MIGSCHRALEKGPQAEFYFNLCLKSENDIKKANTYYCLSMLYLRHHNKTHKNTNKGLEYLDIGNYLLSNPEQNEQKLVTYLANRNGYALGLFRKGETERSIEIMKGTLEKISSKESDKITFFRSVIHQNLYQCYQVQNKLDSAIFHLKEAIKIDPKYFAYYESLGELYLETQQLDQAIETLHEGLKVDDTYFKFYFLLGSIYYQKGEIDKAIPSFEKSHFYNPFDLSTKCYLTSLWNARWLYSKTLENLTEFQLIYANNLTGEVILNNKILALIKTNHDLEEILKMLRSSSLLRKNSKILGEIEKELVKLSSQKKLKN